VQTVDLLRQATARKASDLHLVPGACPLLRIDGNLVQLTNFPMLPHKQIVDLMSQLLTEDQRARLEREYTLDFSLNFELTRYRVNICYQRNGLEAVFRIIPLQIPTPEELMLAPAIVRFAELTHGLVLVTGATGSGKSTTIACLIELINQNRHAHIVTIEDPIEFVYVNKKCVVSQREVGIHTPGFSSALKYVLRQDPDVVVIGEMRDYETISSAISVAETGHLVFATLHALDAPQAIDRMIDVFPGHQIQQIRTQLAGVLKAVVSQTLLPRADGIGRVAAREIMQVTPAVANLLRQGKTHEIYSAIEMGAAQGMMSLERALTDLVKKNLITPEELSNRTKGMENFGSKLRRGMDGSGPAAAA
jgi:twitching motility protein PilT